MTEQSEFTPGPWVARGKVVYLDQKIIANIHGFKMPVISCSRKDDETHAQAGSRLYKEKARVDAIAKANAHLISAAPDLYDALEYCMDHICDMLPDNPNFNEAFKRGRAAITKAKGENQ